MDSTKCSELISVIVPVYRVETYLDKCIMSIANQTYDNLEIILVDDGSPDNCPAMCDAWEEKDGRVKVIHKTNGGLSDARNAGVAVSSGDLIAFVDSDDYLASNYIEDMYSAMKGTHADIVECGVLYVDEVDSVLRKRAIGAEITVNRVDALKRLILEDGVYQTVWNKLYRRSVIENTLFEVGRYHEDDFWTYQVFDQINSLTVLPKPLYYYLQRGDSIMGFGYTLKRLDGLEARYRRMQYLQKYDELAALSQQQLLMDCMWHYQCAEKLLDQQEKQVVRNRIDVILRELSNMHLIQRVGKLTHRLWCWLFIRAPRFAAQLRNALKIGG